MRKLLLILLLTLNLPALSQIEFVPDSNASYVGTFFKRKVDSIFQIDRTGDFNLYLISAHSLGRHQSSVFFLSHKNAIWSARYFEYHYRDSLMKWNEFTVDQSKLQNLWDSLVLQNVLSVRSMDKLEAEFGDLYLGIFDGSHYSFVLTNNSGTKAYSFHCPWYYIEEYPKIPDFVYAWNSVNIIRRYLKLNRRL